MGKRTLVAADLATRGALSAGLVGSIAVNSFRKHDLRRQCADLDVYTDLAAQADASVTFPKPPGNVQVRQRRSVRLPSGRRARNVGTVNLVSTRSGYEPRDPALRRSYLAHTRNQTAWAQHWTHADGPRSTVIVSHGFLASAYVANCGVFDIRRLYDLGYDVLMVSLPFHGRRRGLSQPFSGCEYMAYGPKHTGEANMQAVHDVRTWMNWLFESGVTKVGMTGFSLGGHTTALVAAADDRLSFAVPNAPAVHLPKLVEAWTSLGKVAKHAVERIDGDWDEVTMALEATSPLTYPCQVPREARFIIAGLADRMAVPEQPQLLWEHWDRPKIHWHSGNHMVHPQRADHVSDLCRFLEDIDFANAPAEASTAA